MTEQTPPSPHSRAYAYLRVSTAEQASGGLGLEAQRTAITTECARRGWELAAVFEDRGISAGAASRPGLEAALAACAGDRAGVLIVAKLDRLARSFTHYARIIDQSTHQGWRLLALDTPDATSPHGEAMQAIAAVFARLEQRLISDRTKDALAAARLRGVQLGRPTLVSENVAQEIMRLFKRRRMSARAIARHLTEEGVPSPTGGERWNGATVARVITRNGGTLKRGRPPAKKSSSGAARNRPT